MRCRCCNSLDAKWINYWSEYYCEECVDSIEDTIQEDEDLLEEMSEYGPTD